MSEQLLDDNTDIVSFFETLVSDSPDPDSEYTLLNQADAVIRRVRPWEVLKTLDATKTRTSGDNYQTSKIIPSDFDRPHKLYVGDGQPPLKRIRFEDQFKYKSSPGLYFIDYRNGLMYITDGTWTGVIQNFYLFKPGRLTSDGNNNSRTTPFFPQDFWPIYAYKMAEIQMGGIDFDAINASAVPTWARAYKDLWDSMISWDADLKDSDKLSETYADNNEPLIDLGRLGMQ